MGKLLIYSDSLINLKEYETYVIPANYYQIERFKNPDAFDYGTYLSHLSVYHQAYIKESPLLISSTPSFLKILRDKRAKISAFFNSQFEHTITAEIVNTLLIGEKKNLDRDTKDAFINNGLAHLLAISGMHVGIVLIILKFILGKIPSRVLKNMLIILGIWFYILLSGMQIPAIRAGFMFSLMVIGQISNRNIKVLNSVLFAALVMLSIDPQILFQLSFQLSFMAMASILLFYQKIYQFIEFKSTILIKLWQLVSLNLSVQIFVLPLSIYYFKQLPTYSLFTSMISVPFIIIIMWGSIIMLLSSTFSILIPKCVGYVLEYLVSGYMHLLDWFSNLPHALVQEISIHGLQVIFWMVAVVGFLCFYYQRNRKTTLACASFLPLLLASSVLNIHQEVISEFTIYDEPKKLIIDLKNKENVIRILEDIHYKSYQVPENKDAQIVQLNQDEIIRWNGMSITILNQVPSVEVNFDICIINNASLVGKTTLPCKQVILPRKLRYSEDHSLYYSIKENGSFNLKQFK
ncbi:hypothetical protein GCM10007940_40300 [Portibacter lacus]|uniref:ComEC/Rec2-related protein domain-containing protein n=2 Tax=Portibacter lacus TaxID=1099794 RepID=A0AA37STN2_9BACT|nr:hypothetical protein GCM10007940_40300 [Portibacter lacus]